MAEKIPLAAVVNSLYEALPTLEQRLGEAHWSLFRLALHGHIEALAQRSDPVEQEQIIKAMLSLNDQFQFPEIRSMMRYLRRQSGLYGLENVAVTRSSASGSQDLATAVRQLFQAVHDSERFLNVGFVTSEGEAITTDKPLSLDQPALRLRVNIGQPWGIGEPDKAFPDSLLKPFYEEETIELIVAVSSPEVTVSPPFQSLSLPQQGDSTSVEFDITLTLPGTHTLVVDVIYAGHLLQSRRVMFKVKRHADESLPPSAWPVQAAYTTFTRTTALDPASLTTLAEQPRPLTIVAEREPTTQQIGLRFYDSTGATLNFEISNMTEATLTTALVALRKSLLTLMKVYEENNGLNRQQLVARLADLADQGRALYRSLLPGLTDAERLTESGQKLRAALQPGAIIQVAPLSARLSVPWELLYERPVQTYHPDDTRLCNFHDHESAKDCPHAGDGEVICPHNFWGFRYVIEQLPGRLEPGQPPAQQQLPQWIHNEPPLSFTGLVYPKFTQLRRHWHRLEGLAPASQIDLQQLSTFDKVKTFFKSREKRPHLVYFYAHGGQLNKQPALKVANDRLIKIGDLESWQVNWHRSSPLLILNACDSADYSPDSFEDMIQAFFQHGAAGVIGTQCTIYESLVDTLMPLFLTAFLAQIPAGRALQQARRKRMWENQDPRGLTYSLFAAAELKLAARVIA